MNLMVVLVLLLMLLFWKPEFRRKCENQRVSTDSARRSTFQSPSPLGMLKYHWVYAPEVLLLETVVLTVIDSIKAETIQLRATKDASTDETHARVY